MGRAPYAGEALQWCRIDRQLVFRESQPAKNNNNDREGASATGDVEGTLFFFCSRDLARL